MRTLALLFGYLLLLMTVGRYAPDLAGLTLLILVGFCLLCLPLALMDWKWSTTNFVLFACAISGVFIVAASASLPLTFADHTDFRLLMLAVPGMTLLVSVIRKESGQPLLGKGAPRQNDWTSIRASGVMLGACALVFALTDVLLGGYTSGPPLSALAAMGLTVFLFGLLVPIVADNIAPRWGTRKAT